MADKKIALTGGIATGKTTVANRFRELGAIILDADEYARRAVEPGVPSYAALRDLIGPELFDSGGALDRAKLRQRIIREPALREKVNSILHPFIYGAMRSEWKRQRALHPKAVIIFDIPLLFETRSENNFDIIILAYSSQEVQLQRLRERDKLSASEAEFTVSMQFPIDCKRAGSNYIIENSAELEDTLRQVDEVWEEISSQAG